MSTAPGPAEPPRDCPLCPRLVAFREEWRAREPLWHNAPVPTFGPAAARLLVVGLAPGLRGANRTGRPFTGDYAGELLYRTLIAHSFAAGRFEARIDDGLTLVDAAVTNAVRCVPPANKPLPTEIGTCRLYLQGTLAAHPHVRAMLVLGRIAHESVARAFGLRLKDVPFAHGAVHATPGGLRIYDSYHCSRLNTNTGVLTPAMFDAVVARIRADLRDA
ncbi:uracil-DNA glycosylase [Faunimonas sp. B44]|uniref:uracil-DNA glycosylase n=1 Tax=Faunimonas sp. B44 TaxID=3461493 RepID=UPI0040443D2B